MHPLDGPRAKVKRAKGQVVALYHSTKGFFEQYPYRVVKAEHHRKAGYYSLRAQGGPSSLPDEWGAIIGEIAHDLGSALDGLTWQLALLGPSKPSFHTSFPICLDRTLSKRIGDRNYHAFDACKKVGRGCLQSVPSHLWTRIEAFQPYKRGNGGRHSPLVLLNELNNTDKHRVITVLAATPDGYEIVGLSGGSAIKRWVPLKTNAKIGYVRDLPPDGVRVLDLTGGPFLADGRIKTRIQHEVEVDVHVTPGIRFSSGCDAVKGLPVIRTLDSIADQVNNIVESFSDDFAK